MLSPTVHTDLIQLAKRIQEFVNNPKPPRELLLGPEMKLEEESNIEMALRRG